MAVNNDLDNKIVITDTIMKNALGASYSTNNVALTHNISDTDTRLYSSNKIAVFNTTRPMQSAYDKLCIRNDEMNIIYIDRTIVKSSLIPIGIGLNNVADGNYQGSYFNFNPNRCYPTENWISNYNIEGKDRSGNNVGPLTGSIYSDDNILHNTGYYLWGGSSNTDINICTDFIGGFNRRMTIYIVFCAPISRTFKSKENIISNTTTNDTVDYTNLKITSISNNLNRGYNSSFSCYQNELYKYIFDSFDQIFDNTEYISNNYTLPITYSGQYGNTTCYSNVRDGGIISCNYKYYIRKVVLDPKIEWCNGSPFYEALTVLLKAKDKYGSIRTSSKSNIENYCENPSLNAEASTSTYNYYTITNYNSQSASINVGENGHYLYYGGGTNQGGGSFTFDGTGVILATSSKSYPHTIDHSFLSYPARLLTGESLGIYHSLSYPNDYMSTVNYSSNTVQTKYQNFINNISNYTYVGYSCGINIATDDNVGISPKIINNIKYFWDISSSIDYLGSSIQYLKKGSYDNFVELFLDDTFNFTHHMEMLGFFCTCSARDGEPYLGYPKYPNNTQFYSLLNVTYDSSINYPRYQTVTDNYNNTGYLLNKSGGNPTYAGLYESERYYSF